MQFVYDHDAEIASFVAQFNSRNGSNFGRCKTIGVVDAEGRLLAGIVYFNFDPDAAVMEMGLAAVTPRWLTYQTLRRMFEYPFVECGCQMIYNRVRADDERLIGQMARLNFNLTLIPRMYGRDEDGVIGTLTDDQWLDCAITRRVYRDMRKAA